MDIKIITILKDQPFWKTKCKKKTTMTQNVFYPLIKCYLSIVIPCKTMEIMTITISKIGPFETQNGRRQPWVKMSTLIFFNQVLLFVVVELYFLFNLSYNTSLSHIINNGDNNYHIEKSSIFKFKLMENYYDSECLSWFSFLWSSATVHSSRTLLSV